MKLHAILINAVETALSQIFFEQKYADKVIEKILKSNPKWGARDRAFIAENVYDIVRYWRLLVFLSDSEGNEKRRLKQIIATWFLQKGYAENDWEGFRFLDKNKIKSQSEIAQNQYVIKESIPDWIDNLAKSQLGEATWKREITAMNQPAKVILRANTLKTDSITLQKKLASENILTDTLSDTPDALVLRERKNIFSSSLFKDGFFEVQDAGSQWIAPMLHAESGMRVVDACAGAGGKALHLAALMRNKGSIIALDTEAWKLEELKKRARRAGVGNIETRTIESSKTIKRLHDSADRLLLDVPCSGIGVLRRNPDAKWKISPTFIKSIENTQRDILDRYSKMLKKGGEMVYATCSLLNSEDEDQVQHFLQKQNGGFELLEQKRCSPSLHGYDGFFMARMKKV